MDKIRIRGGRRLKGRIKISGAKNAALPLMAASLLTSDTLTLSNLPQLADIQTMAQLLRQHGIEAIERNSDVGPRVLELTANNITNTTAAYELVRKMRASVLVLGPLLARCGRAEVSLPGGCAIGARPVDLHLKGLSQLGAEIEVTGGYVRAKAPDGLKGAHVVLSQVSVGATENLLMAATLATGETVLENVAREPEVTDLAECLIAMGADIEGVGTEILTVRGIEHLNGAEHIVLPDRIETGTYAIAAAITGGELELVGTRLDLMGVLAERLAEAGVEIEERSTGLLISRTKSALQGIDIMTEPFPGFATDLQAQIMALMTTANGASMITETIFENRFMHVPELRRMGARINLHGASAMVRGVSHLTGAEVMASDLRASASLVLAGLVAKGETLLHRVYHLDRGYECLEQKLSAVGADVSRIR